MRQFANSSDTEKSSFRRPLSAASSAGPSLYSSRAQSRNPFAMMEPRNENIEVPLSPTKRHIKQIEPRSPGRVLLGIDKGVKGSHVSLRRARIVQDNGRNVDLRQSSEASRASNGLSKYESVETAGSTLSTGSQVKSFSERMAESRVQDKTREEKREMIARARGTGFRINRAELESYQAAAAEARAHTPPRSPTKLQGAPGFGKEDVMRSYHHGSSKSGLLKKSKTLPNLQRSLSQKTSETDEKLSSSESAPQGDSALFESFSQLHLSSRILPHSFLQRTLPSETYTPLRIPSLLKNVSSPNYELPEAIVDYVVFGIVGSKTSPKDHKSITNVKRNDSDGKWDDGSQNQKKFMVLQLTDLKWSIDLYLFGTALPRYYRLSPGTLVAVLNPTIMPPRKGREDTGAFSLTLHSGDDTVLEIGMARDLGFCKAVKKDGKQCDSWVDSAKTEYCEWHLHAQISKTQAGRMGVNTGSNGMRSREGRGGGGSWNRYESNEANSRRRGSYGSSGLLPLPEGQRYDRNTGSQYFIASSSAGPASQGMGGPAYRPRRIAKELIGIEDEDPFIAEGQLSRDRDSRLRKRLVVEEKERNIARKLGAMGTGGAGGEYMRQRDSNGDGASDKARSQQGIKKSALGTKANIMDSGSGANGNGKRVGENIRLSPLKKTRFITEIGIREAGRDSLGTKRLDLEEGADEDDLEIV